MLEASDGRVPAILLFGGTDSAGCAGLAMDLRTCAALGVHGACVVTAVTAQSTREVAGLHSVPAEFVALQAETVGRDLEPRAIKTGMLANAEIIAAVARYCETERPEIVVVDPVLVSTTGGVLLEKKALALLNERLFPAASLITPNVPEAALLLGRPLATLGDLHGAARELRERGAKAVLLKGGHLDVTQAIDVLHWEGGELELEAPRLDVANTRGTGCALATAITASLLRGLELDKAVAFAKDWLLGAISAGYAVGKGPGPIDPLG
ncbi:MAG: bifunctional hydroxymethylpyrimidine kinase/phosphomethylpyrimidine kinase [Planctomycetota bacterium]